MFKLLYLVFLTLFLTPVYADSARPEHLVSVGSDGLGWSALSNLFDWDQSKTGGVHDQKSNVTKFNLNYNYILPNQIMIGLEFSYDNETIECSVCGL